MDWGSDELNILKSSKNNACTNDTNHQKSKGCYFSHGNKGNYEKNKKFYRWPVCMKKYGDVPKTML